MNLLLFFGWHVPKDPRPTAVAGTRPHRDVHRMNLRQGTQELLDTLELWVDGTGGHCWNLLGKYPKVCWCLFSPHGLLGDKM